MRFSLILIGADFLGLLVVLTLSPTVFQASDQSGSYQLLTNPGLETYTPPYTWFQDVDCQVADGWQRFWYGGPEPYWMDTRVFANSHLGTGWVERIEGDTSQMILATGPYTAGLQQTVTGLTPGVGYGFHAALLTIFQSSAQPPNHGTMVKQVGLDPTGGVDPQAPTVVWSEPDGHDQGPWDLRRRTAVLAQAPTMTVFIRITSPYGSGGLPYLNQSFLDSAILARTPVVTATSPVISPVPTFTVSWDNARAAPGGELRWYDVQWLDEAEGIWRDWLTRTYHVTATFVGERGRTYRFRARAWQRYANGAHLYSPYRPAGDTATYIQGPGLVGRVLSCEGQPVSGATVAVWDMACAAVSGPDGRYRLLFPATSEPLTFTVSHVAWPAPPPLSGLSFGPTETVAFTWTLRPPGDAVVNGQFEAGLDGWSLLAVGGVTPTVVTEPVHTGYGALALSPPLTLPVQFATGVSQTVVLTDAWEPVLSFWYRPATPATADLLNVVLSVVTRTVTTPPVTTTLILTPPLGVTGWRHLWTPVGPAERSLTATVTVRFWLNGDVGDGAAVVYLDEVSLGGTPGGPYKIYLPLVENKFSATN